MKSQNVSFTAFMVTKGPTNSQVFLQSKISQHLTPHNKGRFSKNCILVPPIPYHTALLNVERGISHVVHAAGEADASKLRDLQKTADPKHWVGYLKKLFNLDKNTYEVNYVITEFKNKQFNPQCFEFKNELNKQSPDLTGQPIKRKRPRIQLPYNTHK